MANLSELINKTSNYDKDERYMATNDLCNELSGDLELDPEKERDICTAVLKQLNDTSNDVQSIAVKCLSILVKKVQEQQVIHICDKLCSLILSDRAELRDIYSIGLKTCIGGLPEEVGPKVANRLSPRLIKGANTDEADSQSIKLECLDLLTDLLSNFGESMEPDHDKIATVTWTQLGSASAVVRKRSTACIGQLATVASDSILNQIVETLLNQIESPKDGHNQRSLIQTVGVMSRTVGFRLGSHLDRVVPLFLKFMRDIDDEAMQTEEGDELRENILHALQSFVMRCPREITNHLTSVLEVVLKFLQFDPNYNYDTDMEDMEDYDDEYDDYDDDEGDYSDDDDTSWKVRRASIKVLTAIIVARPELLNTLYDDAADVLLRRFKEREENVKLGIIGSFTEMIRNTLVAAPSSSSRTSNTATWSDRPASGTFQTPVLQRQRSSVTHLSSRVDSIVSGSIVLFKDKKAIKTKIALFTMLSELVKVLDGGLEDHIDSIVPIATAAVEDRNSTLKLEALSFLTVLFKHSDVPKIQPEIPKVAAVVVNVTNDDWYKVSAQSLRLLSIITSVMRPYSEGGEMFEATSVDYAQWAPKFYQAVLKRMSANDIDQEIKESAIAAMGRIVSCLGDILSSEMDTILPLFLERLRNEVTRVATLRALTSISRSPLTFDFANIMASLTKELSQFLRQQSRTLKQESLNTLDALVESNGGEMTQDMLSQIVTEASNLVSDSDLYLGHNSLHLCVSVLGASGEMSKLAFEKVLPKALILACSPLLQGVALRSLLDFLSKLSATGASMGITAETILQQLLQPIVEGKVDLTRSAVTSVARCVATLCTADGNTDHVNKQVVRFVNDIRSDPINDGFRQVAVLSIGEMGAAVDLSKIEPPVHEVILGLFQSSTKEEIKSASAKALGSLALGNLQVFLPVVLKKLESGGEHQYLLLSSMREIISRFTQTRKASTCVSQDLPIQSILAVLEKHCEDKEEGVRNMVAECLGNLAIIAPEEIIPHLSSEIGDKDKSANALRRWTLITALKFTVLGATEDMQEMLKANIKPFLETLKDEDLSVRRAALVTLNSTAHHQPSLVHDMLSDPIAPILYSEMAVKKELQRKVNLGPFKHLVDDGLPLRKGAFSCLATILEISPDTINVGEFIQYLRSGLGDVEDVQMLCHQILVQLCDYAPLQVLAHTDILVDPLTKTLNKTIKESLVGTEVERAYDVLRSALRALHAITLIPESKGDRKVQDLEQLVQKKPHLKQLMEVEKQHSTGRTV